MKLVRYRTSFNIGFLGLERSERIQLERRIVKVKEWERQTESNFYGESGIPCLEDDEEGKELKSHETNPRGNAKDIFPN